MTLLKSTRHKNKAMRDSCRGKPCQLMLAPQCSSEETTQPAHVQLRGHGGTGTKPSDLFLVDACDNCHAILDGRVKSEHSRDCLDLIALRAMYRKQQYFLDAGLIRLVGDN